MKQLYLVVLFIACYLTAAGQFGNEWINYNQTYYKIPVYKNGVYKITYGALANAGIPVNSIDPRNIQVFNKGQEAYIHVNGESDGVFNSNDYILFWGEKNTGWFDSLLYAPGQVQGNPGYSLVTDTAYYFLTWNASTTNSRMIKETDVAFGSYAESPYFTKEEDVYYSDAYYAGQIDARGSSDAEYITGEGWMANALTLGNTKTFQLPTSKWYTGGPQALVRFSLAGESGTDHHLRVTLGSSKVKVLDTLFNAYPQTIHSSLISTGVFDADQTPLDVVSVPDVGNPADRTAMAWITLSYPHLTDLEGKSTFHMVVPDASGQSKTYLKCNNFVTKGGGASLYDHTNNRIIPVVSAGGYLHMLIPNAGKNKYCSLVSDGDIIEVSVIRKVTYNGKFTDYGNVEKDHNYLILTSRTLAIEGALYKSYRASSQGGGFNPLVVEAEELYDQFAYGIAKHPLAIRRFCDMALSTWSVRPEYLFLLGKSIHAHDEVSAKGFRKSPSNFEACLVPSFGDPPSDLLFTAGLDTAYLYEPAIPIGRLAAKNSQDVLLYLDKVKAYEAQQPAEWMKKVLHFGGGSTSVEANRFRQHLNEYEQSLTDTSFGGTVYTFSKTSADPIQVNLSDSVAHLINNGVSIMTFFGHATSSGFDQNVDAPENFHNKNRYPLMVANSCFSGNLHLAYSGSITEQWVLTPEGGAIACIAQVGLGIEFYTHDYSKSFFKHFSGEDYGKPIGNILQHSIRDMQSKLWPTKATVLEMTLHGDPAIIINAQSKPDYVISTSDVYFSPEDITNEVDSFDVNLVMRNIGKAIHDTILVEVERYLPDGRLGHVYTQQVPAPLYKDTLVFRMPVDLTDGVGINRLQVSVDDLNQVDELKENNNYVSVEFLIKSSDILPVYPPRFAIIPDNQPVLKASTSDPLADITTYVFELDTTDAFNSPMLVSQSMQGSGGVLEWTPPLIAQDSMVYYWRVSPDSSVNGGYNWRQSSFQYIPGKYGWGQAHYFQFRDDDYSLVDYRESNRDWAYVTNAASLQCKTKGAANGSPWPNEYTINGAVQDYGACTATPSIHVAVIDPLSLQPWNTKEYTQFGNVNCVGCCPGRNRAEYFFIFRSADSQQLDSMVSMLQKVPDGYYVLVYSVFGGNYSKWTSAQKNVLVNMGAGLLPGLTDQQPYIFFVRKGDLSTVRDTAGENSNSTIELNMALTNLWYQGEIHSTVIGPTTSWGTMHYRQKKLDAETHDEVRISVTGIGIDGSEAVLLDTIPVDSVPLGPLVNASVYPLIRLEAFTKDDSLRTPVQLKRWQVIHDEVPELAVMPNAFYQVAADTLQEGDEIQMAFAAGNISHADLPDSLLVKYWLMDEGRNRHDFPAFRVKALPAGDTVHVSLAIDTKGLSGEVTVWAEINPVPKGGTTYDQLEQYHYNNLLQVPFHIIQDRINPILDVTFDGIHILNGEVVSSQPSIFITLADENPFIAINDTSLFEVYLKAPDEVESKRVYFIEDGQATMTWKPGNLSKNKFEIHYNPVLEEDGTYQLQIRARDAASNHSGDGNGVYDYLVSFEVINESTITEVMNYPNPFTTSTRFVFTLTGSQVPDDFRIQIMTISGRVVREITSDEIGPIRIGRNITKFAWDGTDQFGDRLANGLYLYRVTTRMNGAEIKHRESGADAYFHSGLGKMYLFR
ncbi:MAG: hypothetical protein H6585_12225 [Flavobacteriales bacterium]|nr:hypothetical protein [Flavobacteriales bacterium]MCB9449097.1 hypothetical protein [Flavobacteriales bacterium]